LIRSSSGARHKRFIPDGRAHRKSRISRSKKYGAALLYSTLRTIGYPRLSGFKRLLAVYSAAKLIEFLDRPSR